MTVLVGEAESRALKWPRVQLGDVAEQCLGKMLDAKKNKGRPLKYLRNPNVQWFKVDVSDLKEMLFEEHEMNRFGLLEGDVVVCEGGEAGRAAIWEGQVRDVKFQKAIHRVRCGPKLHNRFLVHRLMADYHSGRLAEYYTGVTIKHLTGRDLSRYEFELPPVEQQKRIAAILDKADALRAKRRKTLEQLDALAQAIFIEMFGCKANSYLQLPMVLLSDLVEEFRYGTSKKSTQDGVPVLRIPNVARGVIDYSDLKFVELDSAELSRVALRSGDILFVRSNGNPDYIGRCAVFEGAFECVYASYLIRARLRQDLLNPHYLSVYLAGNDGRALLMEKAKTSAGQYNINTDGLGGIEVPLPDLSLQELFVSRLHAINKRRLALSRSLAELDALFSSLQHRAFRGEL